MEMKLEHVQLDFFNVHLNMLLSSFFLWISIRLKNLALSSTFFFVSPTVQMKFSSANTSYKI